MPSGIRWHYPHDGILAGECLPSQGLNCPALLASSYGPLAIPGTHWFSPVE